MEPDGNIRDGSQRKTVVWKWDKTWLGQPYGDLCELGRGDVVRGFGRVLEKKGTLEC